MNRFTLDGNNIYEIIDHVCASIYWKDTKGVYLGCNKYMLEMLNFTDRAAVIGKTDHDLPWKDIAKALKKHDKLAMEKAFIVWKKLIRMRIIKKRFI